MRLPSKVRRVLIGLTLLGVIQGLPVSAQDAPPPAPIEASPPGAITPSTPAAPPAGAAPSAPTPQAPAGPLGFFADPGAWAATVFNTALVGLVRSTSTDVVGLMGGLLGDANVISQTPPVLSYDNDAVRQLWGGTRGVANAGLAVVAAAGGLSMIINPHVRAP